MSVFDGIIGNWIQIKDEYNSLTIEDYGYDTGVVEGTTDNHCVKCVAVNQCYFKNEKGKKLENFNYTGINLIDTMSKGILPGLYHFNCHCEETPANIDNIHDIQLIIPPGKIEYLFNKKGDWINSFGYQQKDYEEFVMILLEKTKEAYFYGEYYIVEWSNYGCKINLKVTIPGKNEKHGKMYKLQTNYMMFPNKKLKMNTPIGGWQK